MPKIRLRPRSFLYDRYWCRGLFSGDPHGWGKHCLETFMNKLSETEFKNILVVRTDRLGDVVLTTPAIGALRKAFPKARISMMVSPATVDLLRRNPYLDEVIVYDRFKEHHGLKGYWKFVLELRQKKFDLAVIYHTKRRINLVCFLAGIPSRIGYRNDKFGFLLTHGLPDTRPLGIKH